LGLFGFFDSDARKETKRVLEAVSEGRAELKESSLHKLRIRGNKERAIVKASFDRKDAVIAQRKAKEKRKKKKRKPGVTPSRGTIPV